MAALFGLLTLFYPALTLAALILFFGAFATVFGLLLIVLGFRLRSWGRGRGGAPQPA